MGPKGLCALETCTHVPVWQHPALTAAVWFSQVPQLCSWPVPQAHQGLQGQVCGPRGPAPRTLSSSLQTESELGHQCLSLSLSHSYFLLRLRMRPAWAGHCHHE